jgi:hypothetical protein
MRAQGDFILTAMTLLAKKISPCCKLRSNTGRLHKCIFEVLLHSQSEDLMLVKNGSIDSLERFST